MGPEVALDRGCGQEWGSMEFRLASAAFIAVLAAYLFLGAMGDTQFGEQRPRDAAYNLLARGLLSGHLALDKEAPPILARLADPYDPAANGAARDPRGRLNDLSYFRGSSTSTSA